MSEISPARNTGSSDGCTGDAKDLAAKAADTYTPAEIQSAGGWGKFEQFLGKKDFEEFKKNLCTQISNQMKQDQKIVAEGQKQLKNVAEGKDPDAD